MPSPTNVPASLPERLADAEGELPEEIVKAIDELALTERTVGVALGASLTSLANGPHRQRADETRSALTATILARLTAAHKERRDENGFACEYDGSLPDDDYTVIWDKGARWVMINRSGKITIGQSPSDGKPCVSTTWGDLLARLF